MSLDLKPIRHRNSFVKAADDKYEAAKQMGYLSHLDRDELLEHVDTQQAQIERLSATLREISEVQPDPDRDWPYQMQGIARAALASQLTPAGEKT